MSGSVAAKASRLVDPAEPIELAAPPRRFVSRGGEKLEAALDAFAIDVTGLRVLDVGASTGGFTDCLLQRGASRITALDVGHGQLHERLRGDPRVVVVERTNARDLGQVQLDVPFDLVVADVSFISLRLLAVPLLDSVEPGGPVVVLVKPQFEAGRAEVGRARGIIRDPTVWRRVLDEVIAAFDATGATIMGCMPSPITGADGNVEFLAHLLAAADGPAPRPIPARRDAMLAEAVDAAVADAAVAGAGS